MTASAVAAENFNLIDFVVLKDGDVVGRADYEESVGEIAARHGAEVIHSYNVQAHLAGPMADTYQVNVWGFDEQNTLDQIVSDPDYKELIPARNEIHDMSQLTMYLGEPIQGADAIQEGTILVDLVSMQDGYGAEARDAYESKILPLAETYGFELVASYGVIQKIGGVGPDNPLRLNLWQVADPSTMQALTNDPAYQALEEERQRITNFDDLTLFLAQPDS
jgi:uncharacterized protein (DUF1330 family)